MKFTNISITNADHLYDYMMAVKKSGITYQTEKISVILNRVVIKCEITEANAFEVCGLQKLASFVEVTKETGHVKSDVFDDPDIEESLKLPLQQFGTVLKKTKEARGIEDDNRMIPIGCVAFDLTAIFRGGAIMGAFGPDLYALFDVPNGYAYTLEDWMEYYIATTLFNTLQKRYISPLCTQHDLLASSWVDACIYPTIDGYASPQVVCSRVFSDNGKWISFIVNDPKDLLLSIREFKETPYMTANVEFLCKTSVYTFFKLLFCLRNPSWLVDHDDFIRLASVKSTDELTILDSDDTGVKNVAYRFISILSDFNAKLAAERVEAPNLSQGQVAVSGIAFDRRWMTQLLLIPMSATIRYSLIIPCEYIYKDMVFLNDVVESCIRMDPRIDGTNDSFSNELERLPVFLDKIKSLKLF